MVVLNRGLVEDDAILIADTEDNLQGLFRKFEITARKYVMAISIKKTKTMVILKEPVCCKFKVEEQGIVQKLGNMLGYLMNATWKNKYITTDRKVTIYKIIVLPVLSYGTEIRTDTTKQNNYVRQHK